MVCEKASFPSLLWEAPQELSATLSPPLPQALFLAGGGAGHRQEISWSKVEVLCLHLGVWRAQQPCKNMPPNSPHYMTLGRPAWQMSLPRRVSLGCSHVWTLPWHDLPCPNSVRWMAVGAGTDPHHLVDHGEGWLNTGWLAEASGKGWQPRRSPTTISSNHMGQDCPPSSTRSYAHRPPTGQKSS